MILPQKTPEQPGPVMISNPPIQQMPLSIDTPRKPPKLKLGETLREKLEDYVKKAHSGNSGAAIRLGEFFLGKWTFPAEFDKSKLFPSDISENPLDWFRIAVRNGNPEAAVRFASYVALRTQSIAYLGAYDLTPQDAENLNREAVQFLQMAMEKGYVPAYMFAHTALRRGELGLAVDVAKSHACIVLVTKSISHPFFEETLKWSNDNIREAERQRASEFVQNGRIVLL